MARPASTTARGYGTAHQRERERWRPHVETGELPCARCHWLIQPGQAWDLGHTDDRTGYIGPEHASCNRTAGARKGAKLARAKLAMTIREW